MADRLKDIEIDEISLVDFAANRKKFLIIKNSKKNTQESLAMQGDNGIINGKVKKMKELKKLFKDYFGDKFEKEEFEKFEKVELKTEILKEMKDAMVLVNKYQDDLPTDLKKGIGVFVKYASYGHEIEDTDDELKKALKKAGAALSKSTVEQVNKAIEILSKLVGLELKKKTDAEIIKEEIESLKKSIEDAGKKKEKTDVEKLTDTIDALQERLKTVEKKKGLKKSIDEDETNNNKSESDWPSFDLE